MARTVCLFACLLLCLLGRSDGDVLCEESFCRSYLFDEGCATPAMHCRINNETHTGIGMLSPTTCNCCEYCLPFIGEGEHCSVGGAGMGTTVGRCGDGLTCVVEADGNFCRRMESKCHSAQDDFDARHTSGEVGAVEQRPACDGKGKFAVYDCVPTQTCFCQSEDGERLFGEVLYLGIWTGMTCGCSRLHDKIKRSISPGVPFPVIGPRCTSDGNFNPVQCLNNVCYCVDRITGVVKDGESVNLYQHPITELSCYNSELDLFPEDERNGPSFNYTSPCFEDMKEKIALIQQSQDEGYIVDFFSTVPECLPDGTYSRVGTDRNGSKICIDEWGQPVGAYQAEPGTDEYEDMDCKCAMSTLLMESSVEKPVCCKNGNFRKIQCRRGQCRCVDNDGRQTERESSDVTTLSCYTEDWRTC